MSNDAYEVLQATKEIYAMQRMEPDKALNGPEFEVWNHLYSGLVLARMELDCLSEKERTALTKFREQIFSQRTNLIVAPNDSFAGLSQQILKLPWFKFAADIAFAEEAVGRAAQALDRYIELKPILTGYKLTDSAAKCLQEAGWTFLFSFDAACVAFCSAVLEQTLRDTLVDAGIITMCSRYTAGKLLKKATQKKLLPEAAQQAASDLIVMRNEVIHRRFEALKDEALKAMDYLGIVLQELGRQSTRQS